MRVQITEAEVPTTSTSYLNCKNLKVNLNIKSMKGPKILSIFKDIHDVLYYSSRNIGVTIEVISLGLQGITCDSSSFKDLYGIARNIYNSLDAKRQKHLNRICERDYGRDAKDYLTLIQKEHQNLNSTVEKATEETRAENNQAATVVEVVEETSTGFEGVSHALPVTTTIKEVEETSAAIRAVTTSNTLVCIYSSCSGQTFDDEDELRDHLSNVHCHKVVKKTRKSKQNLKKSKKSHKKTCKTLETLNKFEAPKDIDCNDISDRSDDLHVPEPEIEPPAFLQRVRLPQPIQPVQPLQVPTVQTTIESRWSALDTALDNILADLDSMNLPESSEMCLDGLENSLSLLSDTSDHTVDSGMHYFEDGVCMVCKCYNPLSLRVTKVCVDKIDEPEPEPVLEDDPSYIRGEHKRPTNLADTIDAKMFGFKDERLKEYDADADIEEQAFNEEMAEDADIYGFADIELSEEELKGKVKVVHERGSSKLLACYKMVKHAWTNRDLDDTLRTEATQQIDAILDCAHSEVVYIGSKPLYVTYVEPRDIYRGFDRFHRTEYGSLLIDPVDEVLKHTRTYQAKLEEAAESKRLYDFLYKGFYTKMADIIVAFGVHALTTKCLTMEAHKKTYDDFWKPFQVTSDAVKLVSSQEEPKPITITRSKIQPTSYENYWEDVKTQYPGKVYASPFNSPPSIKPLDAYEPMSPITVLPYSLREVEPDYTTSEVPPDFTLDVLSPSPSPTSTNFERYLDDNDTEDERVVFNEIDYGLWYEDNVESLMPDESVTVDKIKDGKEYRLSDDLMSLKLYPVHQGKINQGIDYKETEETQDSYNFIMRAAAEPVLERINWSDYDDDAIIRDKAFDLVGGATFKNRAILNLRLRSRIVGLEQEDYDYAASLDAQNVSEDEIYARVRNRVMNRRLEEARRREAEEKRLERELQEASISRRSRVLEEFKARPTFEENPAYNKLGNIFQATTKFSNLTRAKNTIQRVYPFSYDRAFRLNPVEDARTYLQHIRRVVTRDLLATETPYRYVQIGGEYIGHGLQWSTAQASWSEAIRVFLLAYEEHMIKYTEEEVDLNRIYVKVYAVPRAIGVGGASVVGGNPENVIEIDKYAIISPSTKTNCMYVSVGIACGWKDDEKLLWNKKVQQKSGINLKARAGFVHRYYSDVEDIQKVAVYKGVNIQVYDDTNALTFEARIPEEEGKETEPIKLILHDHHYQALIEKSLIPAELEMKLKEPKRRTVRYDKAWEEEKLECKEKKIVCYDIETYQERLRSEEKKDEDEMAEYDSEPYAIGWCFEIDESDMKAPELEDYEIEEYDLVLERDKDCNSIKTKHMLLAYKCLTGPDCLTNFITALKIPQLMDCVAYAHNGGKFDFHVIAKHSNIMSRQDVEIAGTKSIVLNNRIIQIDINFKDKIDVTTKILKNGKTRKIKKYYTVSFRDTYPIFQAPLGKLTDELKVPHKKLEEKIKVHKIITKDNWQEKWIEHDLYTYLKHDCLGLMECVVLFDKDIKSLLGISIVQVVTAASMAKKFFYGKKYQPLCNERSIYPLDHTMEDFVRDSYIGGRVENFVSDEIKGPIYYYDFTSLYPWTYLKNMPTGKPHWLSNPEEPDKSVVANMWNARMNQRRNIGTRCFIWKVKVRCPLHAELKALKENYEKSQSIEDLDRIDALEDKLKRMKPLFGLKDNFSLMFQWYSEWTTMTLCEPEILLAKELNLDYEYEPINALMFSSFAILETTAKALYKLKEEATANGNECQAKAAKIVINSVYGFFGLKMKDRETLEIATRMNSTAALALCQGKLISVEEMGDHLVTRRTKDLEAKGVNCAISSWVTSLARVKLYETIHSIEEQGADIYYCDTDCVMTNLKIEDSGLEEQLMGPGKGKKLGELKNECVSKYEKAQKKNPNLQLKYAFKYGIIVAPKVYWLEPEDPEVKPAKACKGWREDEDKPDTLLTREKYLKMLREKVSLTTQQFLASNSRMIQGGGVTIRDVTKTFRQKINKGNLLGSGKVEAFTK